MKTFLLFLPLALFACGGSPFSAVDIGEAGAADTRAGESDDDAARDASDDAARDADSSTTPDTLDTSSPSDSGTDHQEAETDACTPFDGGSVPSLSVFNPATGSLIQCGTVNIPSQIVVVSGNSCEPAPTPADCRCTGAYTCACVGSPTGCLSSSCTIKDGVVVVTCG